MPFFRCWVMFIGHYFPRIDDEAKMFEAVENIFFRRVWGRVGGYSLYEYA
jgi:hypothetical protein